MKRLNFVFHKVKNVKNNSDDEFVIETDKFILFLEYLLNIESKFHIDKMIYFDDGDDSFRDIVFPLLSPDDYDSINLAITTDWVGKAGYLTFEDIEKYQFLGIKISSHSCSHPAMAITKRGNFVRNTPIGGDYVNSNSGGFENKLSEQQVLFQFLESKKFLENKISVDEFVFPYGLYNQDIIDLNSNQNIYKILSTCDEDVDYGQLLRHRILVTSEMTIGSLESKIKTILEN